AEGIVALGEADAGFIGHQLAVIKPWRGQSEAAIPEELSRGGKKQIAAANDFGDAHGVVVDHDCELITWKIVMTPNDEVAKVFSGDKCLRATRCVRKGNWLAIRNAKAPRSPFTGCKRPVTA